MARKSPEVTRADTERLARARAAGHRGKPVSIAEQRVRTDLVERALINASLCESIVVRMFKVGVDRGDGQKLKMGSSTVRRYCKLVYKRWEDREKASLEAAREGYRQQIAQALSTARARQRRVPAKVRQRREEKDGTTWEEAYEDVPDPDHDAINGYLDKLLKIDGLLGPQQHVVEHRGSVAFAGWSDSDKLRYATTGRKPGEPDPDDEDPFGR